jgi:hypothetical protein
MPLTEDRDFGMDCRNPGSRDGLKFTSFGTGYPLPAGMMGFLIVCKIELMQHAY